MSEKTLKAVGFGPFVFDFNSSELTRKSKVVALRPNAKKMLACLLRSKGSIVTHDQLYAAIWEGRVVEKQAGLHSLVREIRGVLDNKHSDESYLENIPGIGYRFRTIVSPVCDDNKSNTSQVKLRFSKSFALGFAAFPVAFLAYCLILVRLA